jgi:hypothetical protein
MGGLDILNGSMNTLWELDLNQMQSSAEDDMSSQGGEKQPLAWNLIQQSGPTSQRPGNVAYHTSVVYRD